MSDFMASLAKIQKVGVERSKRLDAISSKIKRAEEILAAANAPTACQFSGYIELEWRENHSENGRFRLMCSYAVSGMTNNIVRPLIECPGDVRIDAEKILDSLIARIAKRIERSKK